MRSFGSCLLVFLLSISCATQNSAGEIEEVAWRLTQVGSVAVRSDHALTLQLTRAGKQVGGNLGCNRFSGPYQLQGESIRFGALLSTEMACPQLPLETEYTRALEAARKWRVVDGQLDLYDQDGALLARFAQQ